jgi:hypothetical protein
MAPQNRIKPHCHPINVQGIRGDTPNPMRTVVRTNGYKQGVPRREKIAAENRR